MLARLCAALWPLATAAAAQPMVLALQPEHSFVHFEVLHFGTSTQHGHFGPLAGQVQLDLAARRGRVQVAVDTAAVSTGVPVLDARLRGPEFFDVAAHPTAWFVAEGFDFDASGQLRQVRGEFTLRGRSAPLALAAQSFACQSQACQGVFSAELVRSEWGISFGLPFVADRVRLRVLVSARVL